jgi:alkylation response protein AidB-like acyl-CoA dehydrogenase
MESRWHGLESDQRRLAEQAHALVDDVVTPYVEASREAEWNAPPSRRVPWELLRAVDEAGLRTLGLPTLAGGQGAVPVLSHVVVAEELARGESSLIDILLQGWKVGTIVAAHGVPTVAERHLSRFASDPTFLFSHCSTEPHGSSDRWLGRDVPDAAMATVAEERHGNWVIDGRKQFITNGSDASLYVVYATTTAGVPPSRGTSSFIVTPDAPGFRVGAVHETVGGRLFNNAELILAGCTVPGDHLLVRDTAAGTSGRVFPGSKVIIAAQAVGVAQAAFEAAAGFARHRVQGGGPILRHQAVATRLADMAIRVESARAMVHHAARAVDSGAPHRRSLTFMAKVLATETAFEVARQGVEIHGGLGVMREAGVERLLRDATLFLHLDGTNDIHRFRVVKELFGAEAGTYTQDHDGR